MKFTRTNPILLLAPLLPVLALAAACGGGHDSTQDHVEPVVIQARIAPAVRNETPRQVELSGSVEAEKSAAISTRVMAMVTAVHVKAGDRVQKGKLLLEIDPQAAEGQLAQARGGLGQAQAGLALAERNYERFKALAQVDAASELELDMARMQFEQAKAAVEQAEGAVSSASSVASDSSVTAPFTGRVARKMVDVGDLAAPGRPLLVIESGGGRRLNLSVPESLMAVAGLKIGDPLPVRVDARPDLGDFEGTVSEIDPGADPASHSFRIKVSLPHDDLPSGSAGRAWIGGEIRQVVSAPKDAVYARGGIDLVVVRTAEGFASTRAITLGAPLPEDRVEVLSGLSGDEELLVGLAAVAPLGARVEEIR